MKVCAIYVSERFEMIGFVKEIPGFPSWPLREQKVLQFSNKQNNQYPRQSSYILSMVTSQSCYQERLFSLRLTLQAIVPMLNDAKIVNFITRNISDQGMT